MLVSGPHGRPEAGRIAPDTTAGTDRASRRTPGGGTMHITIRPETTPAARTLAAMATAATLTSLSLTGCAGSPPPGAPPGAGTAVTVPVAGTTSGITTGTPSGPSTGFDVLAHMPPAAKQHTTAGAQAFARYYIEAVSRLLMNPAQGN